MSLPIIENGDQICISISRKILWIEKGKLPNKGEHPLVPEVPGQKPEDVRRYSSVKDLLGDKKGQEALPTVWQLANLVAWACGLCIGDDTELYLQRRPHDVIVFGTSPRKAPQQH